MNLYAVITGDIVHSGKIERGKLLEVLKGCFSDIEKYILQTDTSVFEIYRGDSFQGLLDKPEKALQVSLLIRAGLRRYAFGSKLDNQWDARIAIGLGTVNERQPKIVESAGEAFERSGRALDGMKSRDERIKVATPLPKFNEELAVECALSDTIVRRWSRLQAEAIYAFLLHNKTQEELAAELGISQPAVHKRLVGAGNVDAIQLFIQRFESLAQIWKTQI